GSDHFAELSDLRRVLEGALWDDDEVITIPLQQKRAIALGHLAERRPLPPRHRARRRQFNAIRGHFDSLLTTKRLLRCQGSFRLWGGAESSQAPRDPHAAPHDHEPWNHATLERLRALCPSKPPRTVRGHFSPNHHRQNESDPADHRVSDKSQGESQPLSC